MGEEKDMTPVAESRELPVKHTVIQAGSSFWFPNQGEPMVVVSQADFQRLEPMIPVRISFLQGLTKRECDNKARGEPRCDARAGSCCESCWTRIAAERYLAMSAKERGPF